MPARSEKQRVAMAIALHNPEKLNKKNRGMLKMTPAQLSDYAHGPAAPKAPKRKKWYGESD